MTAFVSLAKLDVSGNACIVRDCEVLRVTDDLSLHLDRLIKEAERDGRPEPVIACCARGRNRPAAACLNHRRKMATWFVNLDLPGFKQGTDTDDLAHQIIGTLCSQS